MLDLALANEKQLMFPHFSAACRKILLLPIGTATVERSFSTMNRIMTNKRCRLNPGHTSQLMQLSIEGPEIPDIRDVGREESGNSA
jgi:hAT family C-terminal dimerisation region